jgi:SAM-dependent methyltransferase
MHYNGLDAVDDCITACGLNGPRAKCVLDVGGGLGGPARHIASSTACNVVSLELQEDCNDKAAEYTLRCGLQGQVQHVCGDIMTDEILHSLKSSLHRHQQASATPDARDATVGNVNTNACFDACVSWLVFLHIADKNRLFMQCNNALHACADTAGDGGLLYFEDFYRRSDNAGTAVAPIPFTSADIESLKKDVYCVGEALPTQTDYVAVLEACGFEVISFTDVTSTFTVLQCSMLCIHIYILTSFHSYSFPSQHTGEWAVFVKNRLRTWEEQEAQIIATHNAAVYKSQLHFYRAIAQLFRTEGEAEAGAGALGGCRVLAKKIRNV